MTDPTNTRFTLYIKDETLLEKLRFIALKKDRSVSYIITEILEEKLASIKTEKN